MLLFRFFRLRLRYHRHTRCHVTGKVTFVDATTDNPTDVILTWKHPNQTAVREYRVTMRSTYFSSVTHVVVERVVNVCIMCFVIVYLSSYFHVLWKHTTIDFELKLRDIKLCTVHYKNL